MLNNNFYLLIGALDSAYEFIGRYYRIPASVIPSGNGNQLNIMETVGLEADLREGHKHKGNQLPAYGDPHTDPSPGTVEENRKLLLDIKNKLLAAEGELSVQLYQAARYSDPLQHAAAWDAFNGVAEQQVYVFATVARRLVWHDATTNAYAEQMPAAGAPEWEMMEMRLRRIIKAFAAISRGGGDPTEPVLAPPILGSSNQTVGT